jgi:predicted phage replisome organizer
MLLVESLTHDGELRFSETIPYNEEMLSVITDTNIDVVRSAMKILQELHMVEILDDKTIFMTEIEKMLGGESWSAERMRRMRENQNVTLPSHCVTSDEEIEKEIEIDKELDTDKDTKVTRKRFTPPTIEDVKAYCQERGKGVNAQKWYDHYTSNGWKVGKNKMSDWRAAVRTWEHDDTKKKPGRYDAILNDRG